MKKFVGCVSMRTKRIIHNVHLLDRHDGLEFGVGVEVFCLVSLLKKPSVFLGLFERQRE